MLFQEIQTLLDQTPLDGICNFPGGIIDVPEHHQYTITKGMTIKGNDTIFNVNGIQIPTNNLFSFDSLPNGSKLYVNKITVNGPDCSTWASTAECNKAAFSYSLYRTWDSVVVFENITTTGGYGTGILRSGGGRLEIKNCDLSGWVDGIAFFESHGGWGDLILRDTQLNAPVKSKYSSIGMYIHPHLHLNAERVTGSNWNRYLIYFNGNPQSAGNHDLIEVEATGCSLIQTGSSSVTTLVRCSENGTVRNGGSFLKGPILAVDCAWRSNGMIGYLDNNYSNRMFVRNLIEPTGTWMAFGANTFGTVDIITSTVNLVPAGRFMSANKLSSPIVNLNSVQFNGSCSGFAINMEGGTLNRINTTIPTNSRAVSPGVIN